MRLGCGHCFTAILVFSYEHWFVCILVAPLPIQFPTNSHVFEDEHSVWALATTWEAQMKFMVSAWPSDGHCGHLGSEAMIGGFLSLVSSSLSYIILSNIFLKLNKI